MKDYVLILKGDGMNHATPEQAKGVQEAYQKWAINLGADYRGGQRLEDAGVVLTSKADKVITDGPFLEASEMIAGTMHVKAENLDGAIAIARELPHLGMYTVEVRPIAMMSNPGDERQ